MRRNEVAVHRPNWCYGLRVHRRHPDPWTSCGFIRSGEDGPVCRIEVSEPWVPALDGIEHFERIEVLYWLHQARRDLVRQSPGNDGKTHGTFGLRSPIRPNPIGISLVRLLGRDGSTLSVRGLDCLDGTPLLDLKPERCPFTPPRDI